uniref:Rhodanese domain-containing protein n=1 Tax=Falco tinnunculus TaxID=100819 RepID=A0A8C4UQI0_FALTI
MAGIALCEPHCLYNILNQKRRVSRLAEANYLCLLDARTQHEYNESHIITARRIEQYLVPDSEELRCVRYCVVYDCETSSLDYSSKGRYEESEVSFYCADLFLKQTELEASRLDPLGEEGGQFTRHPVLILRGGYKRFSACYHFLSTQKILWMPQELDNFQPYPVEILPEKLYMGNFKQACDQQIQRNLKIKAQVNISEQPATLFAEGGKYLHIPVPDSLEADLFSSFATICHFIALVAKVLSPGSYSVQVPNIYLLSCCLQRAWDYVLQCKTNMRPHRGFVKQLSDWETQIYGTTITDISEPNY